MTDQMTLAKEAKEMWSDGYKKHPSIDPFEGSKDKRKVFFGDFYTKEDLLSQVQYYTELIEVCGTDYYIGQYYSQLKDAERHLEIIEEKAKFFFAYCHKGRRKMEKFYKLHEHPKKGWIYFSGEIIAFSKLHYHCYHTKQGIYQDGCESFEVFQTKLELEKYVVEYFDGLLVSSHESYVIVSVFDEEKKHFIGSGGSHIKMVQAILGKRIVLK